MSDAKQENAGETAAAQNKKINTMTLAEIESAIDNTIKNQGGIYSRYAKELIKRRDFLKPQVTK